MIDQDAKESYIKGGGNHCPYCGSQNIEGGDRESDDWGISQGVYCRDCGKEWTDIYRLVDVKES
jgi:transposase-like protein